MNIKSLAILTSKESWFVPYAKEFVRELKGKGYHSRLFHDAEKIPNKYDVIFVLSFFRLIPSHLIKKHPLFLAVHESALPQGKGWAPLFWQILEGKKRIPFCLFQVNGKLDSGDFLLKEYVTFQGGELEEEIREIQATKTIQMCFKFLKLKNKLNPRKQSGKSTFYRRRSPKDSQLSLGKSLREQFDLLRICNNEKYPAHFFSRGHKYILKIQKEKVTNECRD